MQSFPIAFRDIQGDRLRGTDKLVFNLRVFTVQGFDERGSEPDEIYAGLIDIEFLVIEVAQLLGSLEEKIDDDDE